MQQELAFYDDYSLSEIADAYDKLIRINNTLDEGAFLLQIGWGTGYHANTVTNTFTSIIADENADPTEDEDLWMDLRERFRLGQSRSRRDHYDPRCVSENPTDSLSGSKSDIPTGMGENITAWRFMILLLNAAVMPSEGVYTLKKISQAEFRTCLREASATGDFKSYIGYPETRLGSSRR